VTNAIFFINRIFARQYVNDPGENLLFLILDAGNFHNPKDCFGLSGYTVKPLEDITLDTAGHKFKAHVLHMEKGPESVLLIYWMCIDKKPVGWIEQKFIQFFYSMAHKQKIGLMGRLEVPVPTGQVENALVLARHFIKQIGPGIPSDQADYLFGKKVKAYAVRSLSLAQRTTATYNDFKNSFYVERCALSTQWPLWGCAGLA